MPLTVKLAGYNLDSDLLAELKTLLQRLESELGTDLSSTSPSQLKAAVESIVNSLRSSVSLEAMTPETLSAAYARISRDPSHVSELRKSARFSVARARKSNENIIFGLGHASVAEHACFNFDVSGISRLACEELQSHRLVSFTEKSQRYVTFSQEFVIPPEIRGTPHESQYSELVSGLFKEYENLYTALCDYYQSQLKSEPSRIEKREIENRAKEDARYVLPLACSTQLGMTMNARTLEYIVRDLSDHPLQEVRDLGQAILDVVGGLAPSLIKYTKRGSYPRHNYEGVRKRIVNSGRPLKGFDSDAPAAVLVSWTPDGEDELVRALAFSIGHEFNSDDEVRKLAQSPEFWHEVFRDIKPHDAVLREFEMVNMAFICELSAAGFGQLKRHRVMTLLTQPYRFDSGTIIPPAIEAAGLKKQFRSSLEWARKAAEIFENNHRAIAPYTLTNAQKRRVLIRMNARELYHFSRLRCDSHAQWEIRDLATQIISQARQLWPNICKLACGKDQFSSKYQSIFSLKT